MSHLAVALSVPATSDVLATAFSSDATTLCVGTTENNVLQYLTNRQFKQSSVIINSSMTAGADLRAPTICIRFMPESWQRQVEDGQRGAHNMMLVACVDGGLTQWHLGSAKKIQSASFQANPIYALDYAPIGTSVAVGCDDGTVSLLDGNRISQVVARLVPEVDWSWTPKGSQRIQSLRHVDPNVIVSGGWSRSLQVWDVRVGHPVHHIAGPYLCGDGLDVYDGKLVTASFREDDALQLWDLRNLTNPTVRSLDVPSVSIAGDEGPHRPSLFTVKFHPSGASFLAGGSLGQLRHYDAATGSEIMPNHARYSKGLDSAANTTQGHSIFTLAWSPDGRHVGLGGARGMCVAVHV